MRPAAGTRRPEWPSAEERLTAVHAQLVTAVEALAGSQAWARMLQVATRFPDCSPSNVLLIATQRPDATRVAGLRTWNSLGRHVRKGEHGIAILAPCLYPNPDRNQEPGAQPTHEVAPADDRPVNRSELHGFKVVHVFDVSQTDGQPLPDVSPHHLTGQAPAHLWDDLAALVARGGFNLERGPCGEANGWTDFAARTVRVRHDVEPAQAAKTLAHEVGHIRADHHARFPAYARDRLCRGQAEIEAEAIAYLVLSEAGVDSSPYSVAYVAGWSNGDTARLRESANTAITTARTVLREIQGPPQPSLGTGAAPQSTHAAPPPCSTGVQPATLTP